MKETLAKARLWVQQDEGGYSNDANDPGGPTKFGIDIRDYHSYIDPQGTAADVEKLTIEKAFEIYKERYWDTCSCDLLPVGVDYFTFDSGLLSGVGTAIRWLQRSVGATPDGFIGPKTLAAIDKDHPLDIVLKMEALRRQRLRTLSLWSIYGRGWTNRVNKATLRAKKLIAEVPALVESHPTPAVPVGLPLRDKALLNPVLEHLNGKDLGVPTS